MTLAERKVAMTIFQSHACQYSVACLEMLHTECKLLYSHMNDLCVCVLVAQEHPESLDFNIHKLTADNVEAPQAVMEANVSKVSLKDNIYHLMLIQKDNTSNPIIADNDLLITCVVSKT